MVKKASSLIRTTDEQEEAIGLLEEMLAENFKKNPNPKSADKSAFLRTFYSYLLEQINLIGAGREGVEKLLQSVLGEVKNLKKIKVTLALLPNDLILQSMENWLNSNGLQDFIFDLTIDRKILGGSIIVGEKGEYRDFSLSKKLEEYLAAMPA